MYVQKRIRHCSPETQEANENSRRRNREAKNTADELAATLTKELKVKKFIVDSITELEAN